MDIKTLLKQPNLFAIHYSCESLDDTNTSYAPRITSIAILNINSKIVHSFAIHICATEENIVPKDIPNKYDYLEIQMLHKFSQFISENQQAFWLHWNMSSIHYGFSAINLRYQKLTQNNLPNIPDDHCYNLSDLIQDKYGRNCVDHPKMFSLMDLNGGRNRSVLSGKNEAQAFKEKSYVNLHNSTIQKVYWFSEIAKLLAKGKVKTQRSNWHEKINQCTEHSVSKLLGFICVLYTFSQLIMFIIKQIT